MSRLGPIPAPDLSKAHDIRHLSACAHCGEMGDDRRMIRSAPRTDWHGRCYAKRFGRKAFLALPREQTERLMFGDIGPSLMRALVNRGGAA